VEFITHLNYESIVTSLQNMSYAPIRTDSLLNRTDFTEVQESSASTTSNRKNPPRSQRRQKRAATNGGKQELDFPIIVHSHLCWDWVWQRPQQFLSRLSQRHKILFVETIGPDPELAMPHVRFRTVAEYPNITVLRLQFPSWSWGDGAYVDAERFRIVSSFVSGGPLAGQFENPVQWFYDPMAVTAFGGKMGEILTVYDCMDELSKFRFAPAEIHSREAELLATADVVFTGGRKLYESKSRFHDNCHFYGCGVDCAHFGSARNGRTQTPHEIRSLPRPVLGYFGVIDERLDYDLIAALADANRNQSVVMVGPVMKVDPAALPQRPNIHWLGQRSYADLPAICKGFDVCLMPFALNEATEFINPTKTLEYMATGRPIVSTAVPDVVRNFSDVVSVAQSIEDFVGRCESCFKKQNQEVIEQGLVLAGRNSWDSIVAELEGHMRTAILKKAIA
jgi:glycosyltransferase involved in cell wall biosynthesis